MTHTLMTTRTYDFDTEIEQLRSRVNTDLDIKLMNTKRFNQIVSNLKNDIDQKKKDKDQRLAWLQAEMNVLSTRSEVQGEVIDQLNKKNKKNVIVASSISFFIGLFVIPVIALTLV